MQPHQQRVIVERDELSEKLTKLNVFIGGQIYYSLADAERARLAKQAGIMKAYLDILNERIEVFT